MFEEGHPIAWGLNKKISLYIVLYVRMVYVGHHYQMALGLKHEFQALASAERIYH